MEAACELQNECGLYCWKLKWNKQKGKIKSVSPKINLLRDFLLLADEKLPEEFADKVKRFANNWGVLDLCEEHLTPSSHDYNCEPTIPYKKVILRPQVISKVTQKELIYGESLAGWYRLTRVAKALLNIAARLREGKLGLDDDWQDLQKHAHLGWSEAEISKKEGNQKITLKSQKVVIKDILNQFLSSADLRPEIQWGTSENVEIVFNTASPYGSLFANISLQIMMSIGQKSGLALCSGCGSMYPPKRKPIPGRNRFCEKCRERGMPQALASVNYRKRKKAS